MFLRSAVIAFAFCRALSAGEFSVYIGDSSDYHVSRILTDVAGGTFIAGSRAISPGSTEAFLMKLDPAGNIALFNTLSGKGSDIATGIALDSAGNIYIAGTTTSQNLPLFKAFQSAPGPGFIVKYTPDGSQLLWSTYFPGEIAAITVDKAQNIYVTGTATNPNFPVTAGLSAGVYEGVLYTGNTGAFLTKLSADGSRILYSALIAGHQMDCMEFLSCHIAYTNGLAVAVDASGAAYLAGYTWTTDLPATPGAFLAGGVGAFVAKVNAAGTEYSYLTYLDKVAAPASPTPGPATVATAIAVDAAGNAFITGSTFDSQLPGRPVAYAAPVPPSRAFVAKLNPSGSAPVWTSFIGGSKSDGANAIAVDSVGNVWLSGTASSPDFPNLTGWSQGGDFIVGLSPAGSPLIYSSRFPANTVSRSLALDPAGMLHAAGSSGMVSVISPTAVPAPLILGVANAASGIVTGRVVPGEILSIYGPYLGASQNVHVSIDGTPASVLSATASQINVVVPFNLLSVSVPVHITSAAASPPDFIATVIQADPEIFQNPPGEAVVNRDGSVNSSQHPAPPGSVVSIWVDGAVALSDLSVEVDGSSAEVVYAGEASAAIQINFRIPASSMTGIHELTVLNDDAVSQPVYFFTGPESNE